MITSILKRTNAEWCMAPKRSTRERAERPLPLVSPDVAGAAARFGGLCLTRPEFLRRRASRREHPRKRQDSRPPECVRTQGFASERGLPRAAEAQEAHKLKNRNHGKPKRSAQGRAGVRAH